MITGGRQIKPWWCDVKDASNICRKTTAGPLQPDVIRCEYQSLASTPPGMPGTHPPQYFGWGDVNGNIPANIITYFWI